MNINRYTGEASAIDEWMERQRIAAEVKKTNKKDFDSFSKELNAIWDNKCDFCFHRYVCKFKNKGTCPTPNSFFTSKEHDAYVRAEAIEEMLKLSEEWKNNSGSFLDFQRALRQRLKEQKNGQM